ncbi:hypothetical protein MIMGU_mgv1a024555mg [Erythranthe guttata]|uniref:Uncharacterized protein n=1 Tax=Erythranthe guttata TaxID=4155 RepID=A0A022QUB8_ERYGU|nr:hypothetical protein MIMGU_mgv1a024555mg [Erythranthe guttata]
MKQEMNGGENEAEKISYVFKVVVIGDSAVGKTQLLSRFAKNEFCLDSKSTIGVEFQTRTVTINSKLIKAKRESFNLTRSVKTEDAVEFAEKQGLCFFETSALSGDNVETAFYNLLHQIHTTVVSKRRALLDISTNNIVKPHLIMTSSSTSTITGLKIDDDFEISEMKKISTCSC